MRRPRRPPCASPKPGAIMVPLDPSDPRSPDHPIHREQWLELARAIGRAMANEAFDRLYGSRPDAQHEESRRVRKVLKRAAERDIDRGTIPEDRRPRRKRKT